MHFAHLNIPCSVSTATISVENLNPLDFDSGSEVNGKPWIWLTVGVAELGDVVNDVSVCIDLAIDAHGCSKTGPKWVLVEG